MTIGIDARLYGTTHGGIGRYTQELVQNLLAIDPKTRDYVFFVYCKKDEEQIRTNLPKDVLTRVRFILAPYRCYTMAEQIFMPVLISRAKVDLMHFTHFNVPLFYHAPYVVTIHDLISHHFPDERATTLPKWLYKIKLTGYKKVMHHAVMQARAIIVPSQATKKDILHFYSMSDEKKIKVIYEGITDLKSKIKNQKSKYNSCLPTGTAKFKNNKPYILYIGAFYPHKNVVCLIEAFAILKGKHHYDGKLMLVGKKNYFQEQVQKQVYRSTEVQQYSNDILFYGEAADDELAQLYESASLYVFPSLYEGFGLPPLEAMSFGIPVVASNVSAIPEICGNAALYFNPKDIDDMAAKIYTVCINTELRQTLIARGYERVKQFSWQKMAQEILAIYNHTNANRNQTLT